MDIAMVWWHSVYIILHHCGYQTSFFNLVILTEIPKKPKTKLDKEQDQDHSHVKVCC